MASAIDGLWPQACYISYITPYCIYYLIDAQKLLPVGVPNPALRTVLTRSRRASCTVVLAISTAYRRASMEVKRSSSFLSCLTRSSSISACAPSKKTSGLSRRAFLYQGRCRLAASDVSPALRLAILRQQHRPLMGNVLPAVYLKHW